MRPRVVLRIALLASMLAGAGISIPSAAAATVEYEPPMKALAITHPGAMQLAHDHLFVADGNSVVVLTTAGRIQRRLTGMSGIAGMALSRDGASLYVVLATSGRIAVINTKTLKVTARWHVGACPSAIAIGKRAIFYSYGCIDDQGHVAELSMAGKPIGHIAQAFYYPPLLTVAGSRLITGTPRLDAGDITTYAISGTKLTLGAATSAEVNLSELASSPDGSSFASAAAGRYELVTRSPFTMATTATFPSGPYPTAVTYSHDGRLLAGGLAAPYGDGLFVYDRTSGTTLVSGRLYVPGLTYDAGILPGSVVFSADDKRVFALADDGYKTYLVTSTTRAPKSEAISLSVTSPKVGRPLVATVRTDGLVDAAITFVVAAKGGTNQTYVRRTNKAGVAKLSRYVSYSGEVLASYKGDVDHLAAPRRTATYRAPSTISVRLSVGQRTSKGVVYFSGVGQVHAAANLHPVHDGRYLDVSLQMLKSGHWVRVTDTASNVSTSGWASVWVMSARTHVKYRYRFSFAGDDYNNASSATTATFVID